MLWRNASNLDGHLRAGAELVFELVNKQRQNDEIEHAPDAFEKLLPGLGALEQVELGEDSPAVGSTLADLNVRARTGATVIAIVHTGGRGTSSPTGSETLEAGDSLVLTGSHRAVDAAKALLDRATPQDRAESEDK